MRGVFDDELDQRKSNVDAEITLGAGTLLLLSAGLLVVCGACFGMGYIIGHRGATPQAVAQQTESAPTNPQAGSSQQKPKAAAAQAAVPATAQPAPQTDNVPQSAATSPSQTTAVTVPVPSTQGALPGQSTSPAQVAPPAGQPQVRPALPVTSTVTQPAPFYPSRPANSSPSQQAQYAVRSAPMPQGVALWVQIAAVSHIEDAQVLTTALRKRGYTVTPRRESDNLIHVRIGPFTSSDEANRWRVKLLDDGYNAEIQQ
jgi:cell division septation protein DedD